ncbi:MAG: tRNA lysidine(34) synthetase TilS [Marinosulfonomonas sp.]|nr:tRNA lysidine(34) synthetase TilS [Marinosulfonomonas sp.]
MALLHLLHRWAAEKGVDLQAVTVDHGLREAAAKEAKGVAAFCAGLGIAHTKLNWTGWDGKGNLQDQARRARYRLMTKWATARGIETVALGHTADDQAETFLMRLARGSGVDGLSGMQQRRKADGIEWVRPALLLYRQQLRDHLVRHNIDWIDDPSNEDERFERVKARKVLKALAPLGIDVERLAGTAQDLQLARQALAIQTQDAATNIATIQGSDVLLVREMFNLLPPEIHSRLLSHALRWVSKTEYRPRRLALNDTEVALRLRKSSTLNGCKITWSKTEIRITREHQAVKDSVCASDAIWDKRWQFTGPHAKDLEIRALGAAGLAECPDWRSTDLPRASLLATPAVWRNQTLIAAPLAGLSNGWLTLSLFGADHFISSILSH